MKVGTSLQHEYLLYVSPLQNVQFYIVVMTLGEAVE